MHRTRLLTVLALSVTAVTVRAQDNPLSTEVKQAWTRTWNNVVAAAEKMPEANYGFKPAPESQSFAELVAHTADSALGSCSAYNGERKQGAAKGVTAKADLVAALKAAGAECDKAYGGITDATAIQVVQGPRGSRTRLGMLYGNEIHIEHEYAQMAVHLRLKGIVPPSSEPRPSSSK